MSLAEAVGAKPIWVVAAPSSLDAVQAWQLEALESLEFLMGVPHSRSFGAWCSVPGPCPCHVCMNENSQLVILMVDCVHAGGAR